MPIEAGGKPWRLATNLPDMLRFAGMSDPQSAPIAIFMPNPAMSSPTYPAPTAPTTIGWHELYTTDLDTCFDFCSKFFELTKLADMDSKDGCVKDRAQITGKSKPTPKVFSTWSDASTGARA